MIKIIQLIVMNDQILGGDKQVMFGLADDGSIWKMKDDNGVMKFERISGGIK